MLKIKLYFMLIAQVFIIIIAETASEKKYMTQPHHRNRHPKYRKKYKIHNWQSYIPYI